MALEVLAVDLAARRMTETAKEHFELLIARMEQAAESCDPAAFHDADLAFHRAIWDLAANKHLSAALEMIAIRLFIFPVLVRRATLPSEFRENVEQHKGILEGLRTGDPEIARKAFVEHALVYWNKHSKIECTADSLRPVTTA